MDATTLEMSNVLSYLLAKEGLNESALSRKINIPRATINRLVAGKTPDPRASTLQAIAAYFDVTIDQLLGKQPIIKNHDALAATACSYLPILPWQNINNWQKAVTSLNHDNHTDWVPIDMSVESGKFALKIAGDSMEPQFQEGTILLIDPSKTAKNKDFVIVRVDKDKEVLFRQLVLDGKYKFAKAINNIFPTIQLNNNDEILGVVIQTRNCY